MQAPDSPSQPTEKYLSLHVKDEYAQLEMQEDSELMEDLYKILPLTIDTVFDQNQNTINCQFDTLTDLTTASKILELVFQTQLETKKGKGNTAKK